MQGPRRVEDRERGASAGGAGSSRATEPDETSQAASAPDATSAAASAADETSQAASAPNANAANASGAAHRTAAPTAVPRRSARPAPLGAKEARRGRIARWLGGRASRALERLAPWYRLPTVLGLLDLVRIRDRLRRHNLPDTDRLPSTAPADPPPWRDEYRTMRSPDGTYNDLDAPRMGACGARLGRNVPLRHLSAPSAEELLTPNPREISRRL